MRKQLFIVFFVQLVCSLSAQTVDWKRVAQQEEDALQEIYRRSSISASWLKGSSFLMYEQYGRFYLVDARTGRQEPLINDQQQFAVQYQTLTGDTTMKADKLRLYGLSLENNDSRYFYWTRSQKRLVYDRATQRLAWDSRPAEKDGATHREGSFSSGAYTKDSLFTMLGDKYNLHVRNNRTGQIHQLTFDGKEGASYCFTSAKDTIRAGNAMGNWRGHVYIHLMNDDSKVGNLYLIDVLHGDRPRLKTKHMPLPDEKSVRQYKLYWFNADTGEGRVLPIEKFKDQEVKLNYEDCGENLYFTRRNRSVDTLELCKLHLPTGQVSVVIQEVCKPHLNINLFSYRLLHQGREIIWWSERTGRGNYYLYDGNGRLKGRITQGDKLVAGRIEYLDLKKRRLVFIGYGDRQAYDPEYAYYYVADLNGKRQQTLTYGNGTHELQFSEDHRFAIDSYSRMDMPTVYNVVDVDAPTKHFEFARCTDKDLKAAGWQAPVLIDVPAADGKTPLYGVMYLPTHLDKTKKYPIISFVYPGPQDDQIPRSFTLDDAGNQSLAEMGFVVINVQPRGSSPLRGHDFYCFGYGNLRDYPIADDKHTIETLAHRYPFIDLNRVGICGHSGGGFMAVTAMLSYPDFYKVAFSASGNHDNNQYIQWWGETYHGLGKRGSIPTNMELAGNLKGKLMLVTGDVDDNVPPVSTLRMVDALIKKGKRFELMVLPGKDHGVWSPYYQNLMRYYFMENLMHPTSRDVNILTHE